jgi:heme exporter protein D
MAAPEDKMNWHSWQEFAAMGGYGAYVWGSFGVVALAMAFEVWLLGRRARQAGAALARHGGGPA